MASSSILADIIIDKFFYHLPFYRVIQKYKELGVSISSSTIGDWHAAVCEKLKLLKDYQGTIQTDGYQAYDRFEGMQGKLMLGCWAHARRKFVEALNENKTLASKGIEYIAALYKIESDAAQMNLPAAQLAAKRQVEAYPVILDFEDWMQQISARVLKNGRMWRAIQYTYGLLPRLRRYVRDGKYNIDNNLIENAIRPLAIGRKNYLFCGNTDSAIRAGIVYSLIASCKAAQIEPRAWLEDVLTKMPEYETGTKDITPLLPTHWKDTINNR